MTVPATTVVDIHERRQNGDAPLLLDVRTSEEREFANIGGLHIEMGHLPHRLEELEPHKESEIVVYCRSGHRSANVVAWLQSMGFNGALNLEGGILAWSREIDSSIPQY